jgi:RNA polymerase primary sigma factor
MKGHTKAKKKPKTHRAKLRYVDHPELRQARLRKQWLERGSTILESDGLLNGDDERTLFKKYQYCRYRIDRLSRRRDTDPEDLHLWNERLTRVTERLVSANLGLVYEMMRRVRPTHIDREELISEGMLALYRSVQSFNPWSGFRFSTYACNAILRAFGRRIQTENRRSSRSPVQFDPLLDKGAWAVDPRQSEVELYAERLNRIMDNGAAELTPTERLVLSRRFPHNPDAHRQTLAEIGREISVSKERVRQIQNIALAKLRQALEDDPILA